METYDCEQVYDEQIAPLMKQIIEICQQHRLPMLATFAYANGDGQASFCTSALQFGGRENPRLRAAVMAITQDGTPLLTIVATAG